MPSLSTLHKELATRPDPARTLKILKELTHQSNSASELRALHEALLFYKAYPRSKEIYEFCHAELSTFYTRIRSLAEDERESLDQTGIVGTRIFYAYDDPMARWLLTHQHGNIDIDWESYEEKEDDPLASFMPLFMHAIEQDAVDDSDNAVRDLVNAARGKHTALEWILERFQKTFPEQSVREHFFNPLQLPLALELIPEGPSRTTVDDGKPQQVHLWDPINARASFDLIREIKRPLKLPKPLPKKSAEKYLDLAHSVLLIRHRELFPLTYANSHEVYDISFERGIRIIWWMMKPEMRLALEIGWGCIILKNNVPIGYGAGGLLPARAEISINVFDTFRGGEATWLYAQYARICLAICKSDWLATRKWQLGGEGNEEGLLSGSYWFYDKMGFRSTDSNIRKIADQERKKIAAQKGYRTPKNILRKIAQADIVLSLNDKPASEYREYPLGKIGLRATGVIAEQFAGDRRNLTTKILREIHRRYGFNAAKLSTSEKERFAQMCLQILSLKDFANWPRSEQQRVFELCRAKTGPQEATYGHLAKHCEKFFQALR